MSVIAPDTALETDTIVAPSSVAPPRFTTSILCPSSLFPPVAAPGASLMLTLPAPVRIGAVRETCSGIWRIAAPAVWCTEPPRFPSRFAMCSVSAKASNALVFGFTVTSTHNLRSVSYCIEGSGVRFAGFSIQRSPRCWYIPEPRDDSQNHCSMTALPLSETRTCDFK